MTLQINVPYKKEKNLKSVSSLPFSFFVQCCHALVFPAHWATTNRLIELRLHLQGEYCDFISGEACDLFQTNFTNFYWVKI